MTMHAVVSDADMSERIVAAIQKVRRQKQRPTAERIRHMLERDGNAGSDLELDQLLNVAVCSGVVERIYNSSGVVSYKELASNPVSSLTAAATSKSPGDALPDVSKPEPKHKQKNSELPAKESKKGEKKSATSHTLTASSLSHDTMLPDSKPTVVINRHTDLSDVVLQVILRLGCASGKALEKDIRSHYRLDIYPGVDIRRHIRTACKSLVRRERLRQEGNNFVLMGNDDDDVDDVTLTVDRPTRATADKHAETQVEI